MSWRKILSNIAVIFTTKKKSWKRFETNNKIITLNIIFLPNNKEGIIQIHVSTHGLKRKNQIILLMNTYTEK